MKKNVRQQFILQGSPKDKSLISSQLTDALDDFLLDCRVKNLSENTTTFYEGQCRRFIWWAREADYPQDPAFFTSAHIRLFLVYLQQNNHRWDSEHVNANKKLSDSTVSRYFASLRPWFGYMEREGWIESDPFADKRLKAPKIKQKISPSYSDDDLQRFITACEKGVEPYCWRDVAIVYLLLDSGIRNAELCSLRLDNIDLQKGLLKVDGKGAKERMVVVSSVTLKAIREYVRKGRSDSHSEYLFLGSQGPLTNSGLYQMLQRRAKEIGIGDGDVKRFVHRFRHTFAMTWAKAGGPLHALQAILGHETPTMSLKYGRMAGQGMEELHKQFSPVERLQKHKK